MSRGKYIAVINYLRSDDKPGRKLTGPDRSATIQYMRFKADICIHMTASPKHTCNFSLTLNEQLMPLNSRCPSITFMPNRPDKYHVNFWEPAEVGTTYVANIALCFGA